MSNRASNSWLFPYRRAWAAVVTAPLLFALLLVGCGGGAHNSVTSAAGGRVAVKVLWPAYQPIRSAGRYIPAYAQSLFLELYPTATPATRYRISANRPDDKPSTQTIAFNQLLPAGNYTLAVVARVEKNGQGATVASAATAVVVSEGQTFDASVTLATTLKTLAIQGQPLSFPAGSVLSLTGQALDPDGNLVLLPVGALTWSLVSGGSSAALTSDGAFTAIAPGTARVRLSEAAAGVTAEADVTITGAGSNTGGLAKSSWPKSGADVANTGRGGGSGAAGTLIWTYDPDRLSQFFGGGSLGEDGTIYAGISILSSGENKVIGLNRNTGTEKWSAPVSGHPGQPTIGSDGTIYVGGNTGVISALNGQTGAAKWSFQAAAQNPLNNITAGINIGSDGTVFVNAGIAYALDGATGVQKWQANAGAGGAFALANSAPAIGPLNTIYFGGSDPLYAVDGLTGSVLWKVNTPNSIAGVFTTPAVGTDGTVYCIHNGVPSVLYAFDGRTGSKKWEFILSTDRDSGRESPAIGADGTVYAVSIGGPLNALNPATGAIKWTAGSFTSGATPVVGGDGAVYCIRGAVFAFDGATGQSKWSSSVLQDASTKIGLSLGADGSIYAVSTYSVYSFH